MQWDDYGKFQSNTIIPVISTNGYIRIRCILEIRIYNLPLLNFPWAFSWNSKIVACTFYVPVWIIYHLSISMDNRSVCDDTYGSVSIGTAGPWWLPKFTSTSCLVVKYYTVLIFLTKVWLCLLPSVGMFCNILNLPSFDYHANQCRQILQKMIWQR